MTENTSTPPPIRIEDYGINENNPILLESISASYDFCRRLAAFEEDLQFVRQGSTVSENFPKPMDMYDFNRKDRFLCRLYIYPYHSTNIEEVPTPFHEIEEWLEEIYLEEALEEPFEGEWDEELEVDNDVNVRMILTTCLAKNGIGRKGEAIAPDPSAESLFLISTQNLTDTDRRHLEREFVESWNNYASKKIRPNVTFFVNEMLAGNDH